VLEDDPAFEVHLTRDDDRLVPLWERGPVATELKGERPGLFVSIHMNAVSDRGVRGFETYFLSDRRMTEHERRVVALENAAMAFGVRRGTEASDDPELGSILSDLRNFDHQRWSADLAAVVQENLERVHPATNRGVKQGPLAVITNSLMPSVLVELGFISNRDEERMLSDAAFQRSAAESLADAIREFFDRYPPGTGGA
jgi:N-acetylmuramoyl-L-alanine amidase